MNMKIVTNFYENNIDFNLYRELPPPLHAPYSWNHYPKNKLQTGLQTQRFSMLNDGSEEQDVRNCSKLASSYPGIFFNTRNFCLFCSLKI